MKIIDPNMEVTGKHWIHPIPRATSSIRNSLREAANSFLAAIEEMCPPSWLNANVLIKEAIQRLDGTSPPHEMGFISVRNYYCSLALWSIFLLHHFWTKR